MTDYENAPHTTEDLAETEASPEDANHFSSSKHTTTQSLTASEPQVIPTALSMDLKSVEEIISSSERVEAGDTAPSEDINKHDDALNTSSVDSWITPYQIKLTKDIETLQSRRQLVLESQQLNKTLFDSLCAHAQDLRDAFAACVHSFEELSPGVKQALSARQKSLSIVEGQIANLYSQGYGKLVIPTKPAEDFDDLRAEVDNYLSTFMGTEDTLTLRMDDLARSLESKRFSLLRRMTDSADRIKEQHDQFVHRVIEIIDVLEQSPELAQREAAKLESSGQSEAKNWSSTHYETLWKILTDQILASVEIERCAMPETGSPIDFDLQEPVGTEERPDLPEDTVARQVKFGYKQQGRMLRPPHIMAVRNS